MPTKTRSTDILAGLWVVLGTALLVGALCALPLGMGCKAYAGEPPRNVVDVGDDDLTPVRLAALTGPALEATRATAALSGTIPNVAHRTWSAVSGATEIKPSTTQAVVSMNCVNLSSTRVYVGGSGVASTSGIPYCTDSSACPTGAGWSYDAKGVFMIWSGTLNTCGATGLEDCVRCNIGVTQ